MKINYKIIRDQDFLKAQPTMKFFFSDEEDEARIWPSKSAE